MGLIYYDVRLVVKVTDEDDVRGPDDLRRQLVSALENTNIETRIVKLKEQKRVPPVIQPAP